MPKTNPTPPKEEPIQVAETYDRTITIPGAYTQYRDAVVANAAEIAAVTYPDAEQLKVAVDAMAGLKDIIKTVEDVEEQHRKPVNKWLKDIRKMRDDFLATVTQQHLRLTGLVNHYRKKELEAEAERQREAEKLKREAEKKAQKAAEEAAKAATEDERLNAELEAESAKQEIEEAEVALMAPTNTPKGLTTRVRFDFEITDWQKFIAVAPGLWRWMKDDELLKIDRARLVKELNADDYNESKEWLPPETQDSVTHTIGIRVFKSVSTFTR